MWVSASSKGDEMGVIGSVEHVLSVLIKGLTTSVYMLNVCACSKCYPSYELCRYHWRLVDVLSLGKKSINKKKTQCHFRTQHTKIT